MPPRDFTTAPTLDPLEAITRREILRGALALPLLAAVGASCDDDDGEGASGATRAFVDVTGREKQVPVRPQRIVAVHDYNAGVQVLALGGPLVGMNIRDGEFVEDISRYFDLDDVVQIGERGAWDIEKIASLNPDLIVDERYNGSLAVDAETLARLEAFAPVVGIDTFRPVDQVMADYSDLLGKAATVRVEELVAEYDGILDDMRAILGDRWADVTASHIQAHSDSGLLQAWGPTALPHNEILDHMGVTWTAINLEAGKPENGGYLGNISMERINEFNGDIVTVDLSYMPELVEDQPLYQRLPVVVAGQAIELRVLPAGNHYRNYIAVATDIRDQLRAMGDIRTDIV